MNLEEARKLAEGVMVPDHWGKRYAEVEYMARTILELADEVERRQLQMKRLLDMSLDLETEIYRLRQRLADIHKGGGV